MLYNLEPDKSLTGGAWYSDQDFEAEFVGVLSQQCYRFLQQKQEKLKDFNGSPRQWKNMSYASSKEVWKFISELGISRVEKISFIFFYFHVISSQKLYISCFL